MEFLRALRPDIAVVSAGRGNPFGHPVATVLARYAAVGSTVFRTDQDGAVMVDTDGTTVHVQSFTKRSLTLRASQDKGGTRRHEEHEEHEEHELRKP